MSPSELQSALKELGQTQEGFAELLGHGKRTGQYWATQSVPPSVATVVRLLLSRPELVEVIEAINVEQSRKKSSGSKGTRK